eukprot:Sspe_Gene.33829::Locus_16474_Transcript_1_2_Confidence_0.667_Length_1960::g.33829::m.33829
MEGANGNSSPRSSVSGAGALPALVMAHWLGEEKVERFRSVRPVEEVTEVSFVDVDGDLSAFVIEMSRLVLFVTKKGGAGRERAGRVSAVEFSPGSSSVKAVLSSDDDEMEAGWRFHLPRPGGQLSEENELRLFHLSHLVTAAQLTPLLVRDGDPPREVPVDPSQMMADLVAGYARLLGPASISESHDATIAHEGGQLLHSMQQISQQMDKVHQAGQHLRREVIPPLSDTAAQLQTLFARIDVLEQCVEEVDTKLSHLSATVNAATQKSISDRASKFLPFIKKKTAPSIAEIRINGMSTATYEEDLSASLRLFKQLFPTTPAQG